jgi:hypothetical protein
MVGEMAPATSTKAGGNAKQIQTLATETRGKGLRIFWPTKAEHHEVAVIAAHGVRAGGRR